MSCVLCGQPDGLADVAVSPRETTVSLCATCAPMVDGSGPLDEGHLRCLQDSAWSDQPPVQVIAWRLLGKLGTPWAIDLRDMLYLDEDTLAWAQTGPRAVTVDSNGTELADGDSVTLIKDLDVKGANFVAKRGTKVRGIRLSEDPGLVEGRVNGTAIYLKTEFLKKA